MTYGLLIQCSVLGLVVYVALMSNLRRVICNSNNRLFGITSHYILFELHLTRRKFDIRATYKPGLTHLKGGGGGAPKPWPEGGGLFFHE